MRRRLWRPGGQWINHTHPGFLGDHFAVADGTPNVFATDVDADSN
jgi:hypothetical protein